MPKRNRQKVQDRRNSKKEFKAKHDIQKDKFQKEREASVVSLTPQNISQKRALNHFIYKQLVVLSGSAGGGKTEIAVWWACKLWKEGKIDNIVLTRPDKGHGDTYPVPGTDSMKMLQFMFPILMKMKKYLGLGILRNNLKLEDDEVLFNPTTGIQIVSMAKLGGMSFDNRTIIIGDEIQSATIAQVKALTTRAEEDCQIILTGDTTQTPLKNQQNGLEYLERTLLEYPHEDAAVVKFTPDDCCRKGISAHLTRVYEQDGTW